MFRFVLGLAALVAASAAPASTADKPNIVIILADDLGYGDVGCYNPASKIPTPNIDRLAREGVRFSDAHSPSAVCTPTRYALLTGRYAWRTRLQRNVIGPFSPPLIAENQLTVAGMLRGQGYATTCVGKWHLGWGWPKPGDDGKRDFTKPIPDGPTARGFDRYFGTDVPNYPPYCFLENDRTVGIPSAAAPVGRDAFNMAGPMVPDWKLVDVLPGLEKHAVESVETAAKGGKPFFLYLPLTSPHYPIVPAPAFKGKSKAGDFGDFVVQTDHVVGEVLAALKRGGVADETLVIFTSDNGPEITGEVKPGAYDRLKEFGHASMGTLRGAKRDVWEGGHRVPFLARWPVKIAAGRTCDETVCHVDLMATLAAVLDVKLPADAGVDSVNILPALLGEKRPAPLREATVHHSGQGNFAIRRGDWVLILAPTGDDNRKNGEPTWFRKDRGYEPHAEAGELFNLATDPTQKKNLYATETAKVHELTALMERYVAEGRSTPGPRQKNDVPIQLVKTAKAGNPNQKDPPPKNDAPIAPKTVTYKEASGEELRLHVYAPADAKPGDNRTAIVFFFGGGWSGWNPTQFEPFARHFAGLGCVAVCADYRVSSRHKTTPADAVRDAKSAVRYVREHAKEWGADPNRIVAAGGSAGGHLAACTAVVPGFLDETGAKDADAAPNALVLFNPVLDTSAAGFGGGKRGDELKPISPQHHVRKKLPPALVLHGTADTTVPFKQVGAFAKAMRDAGNVCEVEAFEGRGHGFFNHPDFRKGAKSDDYDACVKRATKFLEDHKFLPARVPQK